MSTRFEPSYRFSSEFEINIRDQLICNNIHYNLLGNGFLKIIVFEISLISMLAMDLFKSD